MNQQTWRTSVLHGSLVAFLAGAAAAQTPTELVSVSSTGMQTNVVIFDAENSPVSDDGNIVAFSSPASNLAAGDLNANFDVFVRERATGTTTLVSRSTAGVIGNGASRFASLSDDGRFVAFVSGAWNLVGGDSNGDDDVFLRDRIAGTTVRVTESSSFGLANGPSRYPVLSGDGRFVAFESDATNLVAGDTGFHTDIFVRDMLTGTITRVSVATNGSQATNSSYFPDISDDGSLVVFSSGASNLWPGDTNGQWDVFVHDRNTGVTELVDRLPNGDVPLTGAFNARISGDGTVIAFRSASPDLGAPTDEIFVAERATGAISIVSKNYLGTVANGENYGTSISDDGKLVAFSSKATNLVNLDVGAKEDIFVVDRSNGEVLRCSMSATGASANSYSWVPVISGDGKTVTYTSHASDLVSGDVNSILDIFAHDITATQPLAYCASKLTSLGCSPMIVPNGLPSLSQPSGFLIQGLSINAAKSGLIFYGRSPLKAPFQGGTLCVAPPHKRSPVLNSGGVSGCTGAFNFDFNVWLAAGSDPSVVAGDVLYAQYWFRDPASSFGVGFSDALRFVVYP